MRRQMSLDYLKDRFGIIQKEPTIDPKMIVIHHTHSGSFQSAFWTFQPVKIRGKLRYPKAGRLNLSAHFLVDRAGRIYRLIPENIFGRHIIGIGYMAIGIENVGGTKRFPLTYEQLKANVALVKYLKARFPGIKWLIGHHEYLKFKKTPLWKEKDPKYLTYKPDPGWRFMRNLRNRVKHLNLVSEP
ncbi:N-acetylmuramoyl-L-alanine amidase [Myxococcota bacterium]|nr:N-acetylmuramoyl-L-alanine amidase [Myxococcota bacterium]MBU1381071.1 N-acetylmuramoyl-L-alanine amidase [Myxococcota bacterium]MBU1496317.1 N-acetylmuramoyl-L-alanine amidase [Myxococcota bacterium]